jgi:hypothetical protein
MRKNTSLASKIGHLVASFVTVIVAGAGIATAASGAIFTDTDTSAMDVSSGWVDASLGGSTIVAMPNIKPGDVYFRAVNVANTGSLGFAYRLTASRPAGSGSPLIDSLLVQVWKTETAADCASTTYANGVQLGTEVSLTQLSTPNRDLTPGSSETMCLRITLPSTATYTLAGKSSTVTLTIASEQL